MLAISTPSFPAGMASAPSTATEALKEQARRSGASKPGLGSRAPSTALLYGFTVTARDLGMLGVGVDVHGRPAKEEQRCALL